MKNKTKKRNKKSARKNSQRKLKTTCRALIPLDTDKIRNGFLKIYKRRKKVLERIELQLEKYHENDEPEFQKFLSQRFGAEQTRLRELAEKLSLAQMRREKLRYMAREEGMTQGKYCAYLKSKVMPKIDFWAVLENEILKMQEKQRRLDEKYERYCRECGDYEDGLDDNFEEIFGKDMRSFFNDLFDDIFPESETHSASNKKDLKKLYHKLCLRYHPDKIGAHDAKTKRLWLSIQEAYKTNDLSRLRSIYAGLEIEAGKTELSCSDINTIISENESSIHMMRKQLNSTKKAPYWGFSTWTAKKRKLTEKEMTVYYRHELKIAEQQLQKKEAEIERIIHSCLSKVHSNTQFQKQPNSFQMEFSF